MNAKKRSSFLFIIKSIYFHENVKILWKFLYGNEY